MATIMSIAMSVHDGMLVHDRHVTSTKLIVRESLVFFNGKMESASETICEECMYDQKELFMVGTLSIQNPQR